MHTIQKSFLSTIFLVTFVAHLNPADASSNISAVLPLTATAYGTTLTTVIKIGNQSFNLLPDTGSADLWVLQPDWECYRGHHTGSSVLVPQGNCDYGNGTYTKTSTFTPHEDAWLGIHYGAGDVFGTLGFDSVQVGDIVIPRQEFGMANATNGPADKYSEGIMGLGHQVLSMTHASNYSATSALGLLSNTLWYETSLWSMVKQGMEPYFAFALDRMPFDQEIGHGGYVSFGTLPPVAHSPDFVSIPVEITKTIPASFTNGTKKITEWTLTVQSVTWNGTTYSQSYQAVVDSGNFYFIVPSDLAKGINSAFSPPAIYEPDGPLGPLYSVQCNATPPTDVGFQLGGRMLSIDSSDLIYRDWSGKCYSTVAPTVPLAGIELFFLGDYFLRNVVAVFDFGSDEMRFAARINDSSTFRAQPTSPLVASAAFASRADWLTFGLMCMVGIAALI
ncbi:hypothetical protein LTR37_016280 [Vermiconidia calcicola]|uniref:Uncharacterized protein n=1 Tax=Vermiconidia calcicola TaxID=1690605 RepID=A0ACC3MR10_9PEZI|nr:hypothetical protein LTR37_016280 [Vermiconidia calcicola]